jgi:hypothetical protein
MSQNQFQFSKLHGPSKTAKFQKERGKRKGIWQIQIGVKINYRYFLINDRGWAIIERNHCSALVKQFQTFVEDGQIQQLKNGRKKKFNNEVYKQAYVHVHA